ncbi:4Fe-4S dicluster domain-containing protein [Salipaludibacillus sp. CUR1]|uniref:4Fe-4S dicluster domain-containing protein n=1 Tax=Salipaludibacillus sp. CUR1 TaxID=2820003 RepID=UPI0021043748|nr:4Fe-4S dicluster domain-containing protein [Salipaludibacillus sp. CUR1]
MWRQFLYKRVKERSSLRINEKKCLRNRYKFSDCDKCIKVCPYDALSLVNGKVEMEEDRCRSCGQCVHTCPTEALYFEAEMMDKYDNRISQKEAVTFACTIQSSNDEEDVTFPCLKSLSPEHLMISALYEKKCEVYCDYKQCKSCEAAWEPEEGLKWLAEWNEQTESPKVPLVTNKEEKSGANRTYNRRELFKMTSQQTKSQIGDLILDSYKEVIDLKEKIAPTQKRQYAIAYLKKNQELLKMNMANAKTLSDKLNLTGINVKGDCNICQTCSSLCPAGALKVVEKDSLKVLEFEAGRCVNCDICEKACPSIQKHPVSQLSDLLNKTTLKTMLLDECPKCGSSKHTEEALCEECQRRKDKRESLLSDW